MLFLSPTNQSFGLPWWMQTTLHSVKEDENPISKAEVNLYSQEPLLFVSYHGSPWRDIYLNTIAGLYISRATLNGQFKPDLFVLVFFQCISHLHWSPLMHIEF